MASSKEELKLARDTLRYLFQNLGFLINRKKSKTRTMSEYTIFGYGNQLNRNDTDPSKREKKRKIVQQRQDLLGKSLASIRELSQVIGRLS